MSRLLWVIYNLPLRVPLLAEQQNRTIPNYTFVKWISTKLFELNLGKLLWPQHFDCQTNM